jgi:aminobenzoyl-glutamate utilization protein B
MKLVVISLALFAFSAAAQDPAAQRLAAVKSDLAGQVEAMAKRTQEMVDSVFSFSELGFQEFETSRYLTGILEKEGFRVERGVAGIPTAWTASWGSGKPVIALGSDIDALPQTSQKPGVAYYDPLVAGAPGHGEGHNSGVPLNITAALAVKRWMEREKIRGTLMLWPGVAEEQIAGKAFYIRAGLFKDADVCLFTHVSANLAVTWGGRHDSGLVSVEYTFHGETAHAGSSPWRGRSALDAAELMNAGWNYRREHLRLQHRSHYVITEGGDQPNVVPRTASVWYYFREIDYPGIVNLWRIGDDIAIGAALMTGTSWTSRVLGSAWPGHFNRPVAETMHKNIQAVGLPKWSEADIALARAVQRELGTEERGLNTKIEELAGHVPPGQSRGGGSDDIGDIAWNVPTVVLSYPANMPGPPGHHWASSIAMATPIAHKGVTAGAKVMAMTVADLLLDPKVIGEAWAYFRDVQTKDVKYRPLIRPQDQPPLWLNERIMRQYRDQMRKFYYDPSRYSTYLEQLGIAYPTIRK